MDLRSEPIYIPFSYERIIRMKDTRIPMKTHPNDTFYVYESTLKWAMTTIFIALPTSILLTDDIVNQYNILL